MFLKDLFSRTPTYFLLYINDLYINDHFADDTNLLYLGRFFKKLNKLVYIDLNSLSVKLAVLLIDGLRQCQSEPAKATQNHSELARATQESPRASQSQVEPTRARQESMKI